MNRIDRLLGILLLLQTKRYLMAEKIAAHYQISVRTVYRDFKALVERHLIAWCHERQEYRDFRVSRIADIKCLDDPFHNKDHVSVGDYMQMLPVNY